MGDALRNVVDGGGGQGECTRFLKLTIACTVLKFEPNLTSVNRQGGRTGMKSSKIRRAIRQDAVKLPGIDAPYVEKMTFMFDYKLLVLQNLKKRISRALGKSPYLIAGGEGGASDYACARVFKDCTAYC